MARADCPPTLRSLTEPSAPPAASRNLPGTGFLYRRRPGCASLTGAAGTQTLPRARPCLAPSLPLAPELVWPHTHHHLTLPYLCVGGAALSRLSLHELEGPCELRPIPHLPPGPPPRTLCCLQFLRGWAGGQAAPPNPPPLLWPFMRVARSRQGVWGPSAPQRVVWVAAGIDNYPNPQRERGLLPWGRSPGGRTAALTHFGSFPFFIEATLVGSRYQASGRREGPWRGGGSRGPGARAAGGRCRGWLGRVPQTPSPLKFISAPPPGLSPGSLPVAEAAPAPPHTPLSSGFFLCNLFFKKSLYYFFITAAAAAAGGLGFYFFSAGGGGGAILSLCLS